MNILSYITTMVHKQKKKLTDETSTSEMLNHQPHTPILASHVRTCLPFRV